MNKKTTNPKALKILHEMFGDPPEKEEPETIEISPETKEVEKEIPQNFYHQILLYAKNWYKRSDNIIEDLKVLLSEYGMIPLECISDHDIYEALAGCFAEYCPPYEMREAIQKLAGWHWWKPQNELKPEEVMLGKLSIAKGKYVDPTQLLPVLVKERQH